MYSNVT